MLLGEASALFLLCRLRFGGGAGGFEFCFAFGNGVGVVGGGDLPFLGGFRCGFRAQDRFFGGLGLCGDPTVHLLRGFGFRGEPGILGGAEFCLGGGFRVGIGCGSRAGDRGFGRKIVRGVAGGGCGLQLGFGNRFYFRSGAELGLGLRFRMLCGAREFGGFGGLRCFLSGDRFGVGAGFFTGFRAGHGDRGRTGLGGGFRFGGGAEIRFQRGTGLRGDPAFHFLVGARFGRGARLFRGLEFRVSGGSKSGFFLFFCAGAGSEGIPCLLGGFRLGGGKNRGVLDGAGLRGDAELRIFRRSDTRFSDLGSAGIAGVLRPQRLLGFAGRGHCGGGFGLRDGGGLCLLAPLFRGGRFFRRSEFFGGSSSGGRHGFRQFPHVVKGFPVLHPLGPDEVHGGLDRRVGDGFAQLLQRQRPEPIVVPHVEPIVSAGRLDPCLLLRARLDSRLGSGLRPFAGEFFLFAPRSPGWFRGIG